MSMGLQNNPFSEVGFERLDDIVVNVLKRGHNGNGYECGVRFQERNSVTEGTVTPYEAERIRGLVDGSQPPLQAAVAIAGIINEVRIRALPQPVEGEA